MQHLTFQIKLLMRLGTHIMRLVDSSILEKNKYYQSINMIKFYRKSTFISVEQLIQIHRLV